MRRARYPSPNLAQKQLALVSAMVIFVYWFVVFMTPLLIIDPRIRSEAPLGLWCAIAAAIGYFSYTGVRAWRRGWKARFILRIVVPASLLATSCLFTGAIVLFR